MQVITPKLYIDNKMEEERKEGIGTSRSIGNREGRAINDQVKKRRRIEKVKVEETLILTEKLEEAKRIAAQLHPVLSDKETRGLEVGTLQCPS